MDANKIHRRVTLHAIPFQSWKVCYRSQKNDRRCI